MLPGHISGAAWCGVAMSKNQPRCHCGGEMNRNGTTRKGTTRWRCKQCGASSVKRRGGITNAAVFTAFIDHLTVWKIEMVAAW